MRSHLIGFASALAATSCSYDWDSYDPRLAAAAQATNASSGATGGSGQGGATTAMVASSSMSAGGAGGAPELSYRDVVLEDAPLGYWRLGEPPMSAMGMNEIAQGVPGAYVDSVELGVPGALAGDSNTAAGFDGMTASFELGDIFDFVGMAAFSLEAWIRPTSYSGDYQGVFSKEMYDVDGREGYLLTVRGGEFIAVERWRDGVQTWVGVPSPPTGSFVHVVATFDGTTMCIYLDVSMSSCVTSDVILADTSAPLLIGHRGAPSETFAGVIDEIAIYDHALSSARINAHYAAGVGP